MKIHRPILVLLAVLAILAIGPWAASAPAATTKWLWTPGPALDALGNTLAPALYYEVFVSVDSGPDLLVATVSDTTWQHESIAGATYRVSVRGVDAYGRRSSLSAPSQPFTAPTVLGVPDALGMSLGPAYPNPFNPVTTIAYTVPEGVDGPVDLRILDARGRLVQVLEVDSGPGEHTVRWDGRDHRGAAAQSGVYLVQFRCGGAASARKITLLK